MEEGVTYLRLDHAAFYKHVRFSPAATSADGRQTDQYGRDDLVTGSPVLPGRLDVEGNSGA